MRTLPAGVLALSSLLLWIPVGGSGQQRRPGPSHVAREALERCDAAATSGDEAAADEASATAERAAESIPAQRAPDALVIRAQVLTRCRIPFAAIMVRGTLVDRSNELLERALSLDAGHLAAGFTLGVNHYRSPAFLGRGADAIAAFEALLARHGTGDDPRLASAHLMLGELYARAGREGEAETTWRLGAERFPRHQGLREKLDSLAATGAAAPPGPPGRPDDPAGGPDAPAYRLPPLVVEPGGFSMEDPRSATRLTRLDVYALPGGAADVMQAFRAMPGVTQVSDGSDLYVRGGDPAEAPIWLDGARLFEAGKFETLHGSMFGVLEPSTLARAYFSSGGFSSRWGNALSGVVDIETEGRPTERRARLGVNLTSLGGSVWRPLGRRAGFWSTGMLTHTGALLALHGRAADYPGAPSAAQAMAALVFEPRRGLTLKASALTESDESVALARAQGWEGPFRSAATSRLGTVSLRLVDRDGSASLRGTFGASMRRHAFDFGVLDREVEDRGVSARLEGEVDRVGASVRSGLEAVALATEGEGRVPAGRELVPGSPALELEGGARHARHLGAWIEVEGRPARRLALVAGVRADALPGEDGVSVDPRLAAAWERDEWTVRLAGGLYSQGRWRRRPDVPDDGRPNGVPLRARHLVGGVQRDGPVSVRAEAYLKDYEDYEPHPAGAGPRVADGRARGLDLLVQWSGAEPVSGWLAYSLLDASLELADGTTTPAIHDVTHTLAAVVRIGLTDSWELGLTGRYATGRPFTPIRGAGPPIPGRPLVPEYGPVLSARYPDYRRLDARLTRFVDLSGRSLVLYLEGLNVLGRRNVIGYTWDAAYRNPEPVRAFFSARTLVLGAEWAS